MHTVELQPGKKVYFCSDHHLGAPTPALSKPRELKFLSWLKMIEKDAQALFIMGDLFDFWHDWKFVVPRGFVRILGKLAEMQDQGIQIYFFTGNHDLWVRDYFETEIGCTVFQNKQIFHIQGKKMLLAHGDGLGPGDKGYKRMKKLFTHPLAQWAFRWIHPDISMKIATYLSTQNKMISGKEDEKFLGEDKEFLIQYCKKKLETAHYDYFIFGHRHLPMVLDLKENTSQYINLGDWISYFTYGEFSEKFELKKFES